MADNIKYKNSEGYSDPTSYIALSAVQKEQNEADARLAQLIRTVKNTIDLAGFDLVSRIEVRDRKTGKVFR